MFEVVPLTRSDGRPRPSATCATIARRVGSARSSMPSPLRAGMLEW